MWKLLRRKHKMQLFRPTPSTKVQTMKDGISIKVERVAFRPFYDTTWQIEVRPYHLKGVKNAINLHNVFSCTIVRDEMETAENLEKLVRKFGEKISFDTVKKLDQHAVLYYD